MLISRIPFLFYRLIYFIIFFVQHQCLVKLQGFEPVSPKGKKDPSTHPLTFPFFSPIIKMYAQKYKIYNT